MQSGHYIAIHADIRAPSVGYVDLEDSLDNKILDSNSENISTRTTIVPALSFGITNPDGAGISVGDGVLVLRVTDKDSQIIGVVASAGDYDDVTKEFDLSGLVLEPEPQEET